ncbi:hypothetical protein [Endozoicomonas atrinae]|uniref:hypothetical protein n=1 Tax=Endozoicomonas atrinae TaxID=1333660 RepID=UPI003AFF810D
MDSGRSAGLFNNNQYAYVNNTLSELEAIHRNHKRAELNIFRELKHAEDRDQGAVWHRKVEVVQSQTSFLQRLLNHFTAEGRKQRRQKREAADLFRSQVWELLQTDEAPNSLKRQIIQDVKSGVLPFLKKSERKAILRDQDTILRGSEERRIVREAAGLLRKGIPELLLRLPKVSLEDSRGVLKAYYQLTVLSPELLPRGHKGECNLNCVNACR